MWKIFAGLCIRRPTVLSPQLTPLQRQVQDFFAEVDLQRSHLSEHEVRHRDDLKHMEQAAREQQEGRLSKTQSQTQTVGAAGSLLTAKDMELMWEAEEKEFWKEVKSVGLFESCRFSVPSDSTAASGEGETCVQTTGTATAWRKLDRNLVLLTRQRLGNSFDWGLPVVEVVGSATLRSAVEGLAKDILPPEARCMIVGNAPVAVHKYAYRIEEGKDKGQRQGVLMYFLNAYVDKLWRGENVQVDAVAEGKEDEANFAWTCIEEMQDFITDKKFLRRLRTFIVEY